MTIFFSCLAVCFWSSTAGAVDASQLRIVYPIASQYYPVILPGAQLPALTGVTRAQIHAYVWRGARFVPIPFQIDRRDEHGQLLLDEAMADALAPNAQFNARDECVFMAGDLGERATTSFIASVSEKLVEVELRDPKTAKQAWIYLAIQASVPPTVSSGSYVYYLADKDALATGTYRMGFSSRMPMLANSVQWFDPLVQDYGVNVLDVMKIRHTGRFLRGFTFRRGVEDYRSRLMGVRVGPVRIVRRTENSIRVFLGFRSPTITVDYISYAQAILADIRLDIPFRNDWFFSDLASVTTWDGNDTAEFPRSTVYSHSVPEGFEINGRMTEAKGRFNASDDGAFAIVNKYGTLLVTMDFPSEEPIRRRVYVSDDRSALDPPDNIPGQFGNIGFRTTGWEKLARGTHHLTYRAMLIKDLSVVQGLRLLEDAPPFY